ncbi:MAG: segregation and condensation protein A [Planctomycetota bacterium]|jgi:segregation and condensation protein A
MTDPATTITADSAPPDVAPKPVEGSRPDDFTVRLDEVFQGPLDLLLHLVKEQEVEIQDVKLANIAISYMEHVRALKDLDIEVAGEFLVMAATLMAIKSRSLLPKEVVELDDDLDPHDELIQRLIEYRRFKGASDDLEDRLVRRTLEFERGYLGEVRDNEPERTFELGEITAWDLLATFSRLMRETVTGRTHRIKSDPRPLRWYVQTIGMAVRGHPEGATLRHLVEALDDVPSREAIVGAFCALLELMKIGLVSAKQDTQQDEILLHWAADASEEGDLDDLIRASRFMDEDEDDDEEPDGALSGPELDIPELGIQESALPEPGPPQPPSPEPEASELGSPEEDAEPSDTEGALDV